MTLLACRFLILPAMEHRRIGVWLPLVMAVLLLCARPAEGIGFGTYIPDYTVGISGSRIIGVPDGIAPPRAAAPVPRAGTGTDGSPARTKMLIAAL